jgi:hypothetical protein
MLVAAKISLRSGVSVAEVAAAINEAEERIRAAVRVRTVIYLEPDVFVAGTGSPGPESAGQGSAAAEVIDGA